MEGHEERKKWALAVKSVTLWRRRKRKVRKKETGKVIRVTWYECASVRRCEGLIGLRQRLIRRNASLTNIKELTAPSFGTALAKVPRPRVQCCHGSDASWH